MNWSRASINRLTELYADGLPYTQIGIVMEISSSAIAGKVKRLKENGTIKTIRKPCITPRPVKSFVFGKGPEKCVKLAPLPLPDPEPSRETAVSTLAVKDGMCRWPVTDGPEWMHCGAKTTEVYCAFHKAKSITPSLPRRAA
jgi:hypothetical protein